MFYISWYFIQYPHVWITEYFLSCYKFKWIRREWRLLQAVQKDVEEVMDSWGHVLLDSQHCPEFNVSLPEIQTEWLQKTKILVQISEHYIATFSENR